MAGVSPGKGENGERRERAALHFELEIEEGGRGKKGEGHSVILHPQREGESSLPSRGRGEGVPGISRAKRRVSQTIDLGSTGRGEEGKRAFDLSALEPEEDERKRILVGEEKRL